MSEAVDIARAFREKYIKGKISNITKRIDVLDHNNYTINETFFLFYSLSTKIKEKAKLRTALLKYLKEKTLTMNEEQLNNDINLKKMIDQLAEIDKDTIRHLKSMKIVCNSMQELVEEEEKITESRFYIE